MKIQEKLAYIQANYFSEWFKTRKSVEDELSSKQSIFCMCGRLATGLHERHCKKFNDKVTSETLKRLSHLITLK